MAGSPNFARTAKMYVSTVDEKTAHTPDNTFEITPLSGYTLSQSVGTETISLNESGCTSCRSSQTFNTSLDPAQVAFGTYLQPYFDTEYNTANVDINRCIEQILWNATVAQDLVTDLVVGSVADAARGVVAAHSLKSNVGADEPLTIDFVNSNTSQLLQLYIFFVFDNATFMVSKTQMESAEFDFSIDSIAQLNWTMSGSEIVDVTSLSLPWVAGTNFEALPQDRTPALTPDYINNKLSAMTITVVGNQGTLINGTIYTVNLTGGNVTVANNISYLTPEELSQVSVPAFGSTGARSITGSVSAYLKSDTATGADAADGTAAKPYGTGRLLTDMLANKGLVTNTFKVLIDIGGCAGYPKVEVEISNAILIFPTLDSGDILGTTIGFSGKSVGADCAGDEMVVRYFSSDTPVPAAAGGVVPKP